LKPTFTSRTLAGSTPALCRAADGLAGEIGDALDVRGGQRDDRGQRALDERPDRDQFQAFVAGEQQLGLVGDRHVDLAGGEQLQRFGAFGGDHRFHVESGGAEVPGGDRRVERRVVGVREPVEHHREGLGAGRRDRVLLGPTGGEGDGEGERREGGNEDRGTANDRQDSQLMSPLGWLAHGASRRSSSERV
jgi:hypothetical protein